ELRDRVVGWVDAEDRRAVPRGRPHVAVTYHEAISAPFPPTVDRKREGLLNRPTAWVNPTELVDARLRELADDPGAAEPVCHGRKRSKAEAACELRRRPEMHIRDWHGG